MLTPMRGIRSKLLLAALAAAMLAGPAAAAEGRIVHGRSIGPIAIGDERASIAARGLGGGIVIVRTPNPQTPRKRNHDAVTVAYPALAIVVRFGTDEASAAAVRITTRSRRYRTVAGLGVRSTRSRILALHSNAVCGPALCRIGPRGSDRRVTRFHLAGPRVARVDVFRVP